VREASPVRTPPAYATAPSTIPGYDARPLALGAVAIDSPTAISLGAEHYGATGAVQFRVDTAPAHGNLTVASGSLFADPNISYQPNPGYRGPDSFTYVAQDSASSYPHHPAEATVSLNVGPLAVPTAPPARPSPVAPINTSPPKTSGRFTAGQIKISLRSALTPPGKAARIRVLLKNGGFSFSFKALAPGQLVISWYLVPKRSHATKHRPKPILVAIGQLTFSTAHTAKINVKLTAVGKTLLRHAKGIRLIATGSFKPRGKPTIITTNIVALLR
jgi:hypothetical protein